MAFKRDEHFRKGCPFFFFYFKYIRQCIKPNVFLKKIGKVGEYTVGKLVVGENDLRTWCLQNGKQNLLDEWDDENNALKPTGITYGSSEKVYWICAQGHKYRQVLHKRTNQNCGCPYCSGRRVLAGYNDLQTWCLKNDYKSLLEEWDDNNDLKPTEVTSGTQKKICWRCSQGHVWQASVASRTYSRAGCPYCSGLKVLTGFNDLRTWCTLPGRPDTLTASEIFLYSFISP